MSDTDLSDLIEFIQHLKKGFDKDLFQSKLEELAYVAESTGIAPDDFHTLFKLWLNLSIPIAKWITLGACLVPRDQVEQRTVDYAFRWILANSNCEVHTSYSRMAFLLDWLTAAMDCDSIDLATLDSGYEILYSLLDFELLTAHVLKLVYTLTKPSDVTRKRVLKLIYCSRKREGKKNLFRHIQVLLGLFKSYKPECVPEDIPAIAIHTSFRKINPNLLARFKMIQERRNVTSKERFRLLSWMNPLSSVGGRNKKSDPLVPNMVYLSTGKNYNKPVGKPCDFSDPVTLLQHTVGRGLHRPARLRAFLCNHSGLTLLAICSESEQLFYDNDLHHLLTACFLDSSPHSYAEKADFLHRLCVMQRTLLQAVPAVTRFLAQYLPFWNERDYFSEVLGLVEWVSLESAEQVRYIAESLQKVYHRASPVQQCAILRALNNMYANMVFSMSRENQHFLSSRKHHNTEPLRLYLASIISNMCQKGLQANPEDMRVLYGSLWGAEQCARADLRHTRTLAVVPGSLSLSIPLLSLSAACQDNVAALLLLYRKIFSAMKSANKPKDETYMAQRKTLESYTSDFLNCLYHEQAFTGRKSGIIFEKLHPQLVAKLCDLVPEADGKFSLRNSLAFAPYIRFEAAPSGGVMSNKLCFETLKHSFPNLSTFLTKAVHELRI